MKQSLIFLLVLALNGCAMTFAENVEQNKEQCRAIGYAANSDAERDCALKIQLQRGGV